MLLSQYIPGGDGDVEEAIVVRLADGSYPVRFGCRKLRQYPAGFGETAVGESSELARDDGARPARARPGRLRRGGGGGDQAPRGNGRAMVLGGQCAPARTVGPRRRVRCGSLTTCGGRLCGRELGPQPRFDRACAFVQPDLDWHGVLPALRGAPARSRLGLAGRLLRPYLGARELGMFDPRDPGP